MTCLRSSTLFCPALFAACLVPGALHSQTLPPLPLKGTYQILDTPGCGSLSPESINNKGVISGSCVNHGLVRDPSGTFTTFDVPGADSTDAALINEAGTVVGRYIAANTVHGFLRTPDGAITTFDAPGALNTVPLQMNDLGTVTGYYETPGPHGFVRFPDGRFATIDVPGSPYIRPQGINNRNVVVGYYWDSADNEHSFLWTQSTGLINVCSARSKH
ncbi:MAG: hypothetical protein ABI693_00010 [Bryobacteraceae bacterium]